MEIVRLVEGHRCWEAEAGWDGGIPWECHKPRGHPVWLRRRHSSKQILLGDVTTGGIGGDVM